MTLIPRYVILLWGCQAEFTGEELPGGQKWGFLDLVLTAEAWVSALGEHSQTWGWGVRGSGARNQRKGRKARKVAGVDGGGVAEGGGGGAGQGAGWTVPIGSSWQAQRPVVEQQRRQRARLGEWGYVPGPVRQSLGLNSGFR